MEAGLNKVIKVFLLSILIVLDMNCIAKPMQNSTIHEKMIKNLSGETCQTSMSSVAVVDRKVYAVCNKQSQLYMAESFGKEWVVVANAAEKSINSINMNKILSIAVVPDKDSEKYTIFLGGDKAHLQKSIDGGQTWLNVQDPDIGNINALYYESNTLYAISSTSNKVAKFNILENKWSYVINENIHNVSYFTVDENGVILGSANNNFLSYSTLFMLKDNILSGLHGSGGAHSFIVLDNSEGNLYYQELSGSKNICELNYIVKSKPHCFPGNGLAIDAFTTIYGDGAKSWVAKFHGDHDLMVSTDKGASWQNPLL